MIPSTTNQYLVTEDWKKIYQSYPNAEFQSYDFETLRRVMISYLQENYPEDFNDYTDSSEYLALVDLIAFLGQNLSFRVDLNARENFLETAQRRDSILRLAKLIGYNPSRNTAASGFLKIVSISTSDVVTDTNGYNLSNQIINWNDPTNSNWYEQFITILNSAMPSGVIFGRPYDEAVIDGIDTQQYRVDSSNADVPVFSFTSNINGTTMNFELVSSLFAGQGYIYEEPPKPGSQFSFIYKNDNQGNGSANTGFFVNFKQGKLSTSNFTVKQPVPNELISVNASGTNSSDVWLWQLGLNGSYETLWTKVADLVGNNVIYNSITSQIKTVYSVLTRDQDQFDLSFADGSFGALPLGDFAVFYRQSNGLSYVIRPDQLSNITVNIPYNNKNGQANTLRVVLSLQETVSNSQATETDANIKLKAPQTYYVQNRMVTAEDYNIAPLNVGTDILKIHSINRTASGISKYFELTDVSGEYSGTNIFATDGMIYKQFKQHSFGFQFITQTDIIGLLENKIKSILISPEVYNFYIDQYPRIDLAGTGAIWNQSTKSTNQSTGYVTITNTPAAVGSFSGNNLQYLMPGALVKFVPPQGQYFLPNNTLTYTQDSTTRTYIWSQVESVYGDGSNGGAGNLSNGTGPIVFSDPIPSSSLLVEAIPAFEDALPTAIQNEIVDIIFENKNLGIAFDATSRSWYIITDTNLDLMSGFSLDFQQDTSNVGKDNSWLISFQWNNTGYQVNYRTLNYIFQSEKQTAFFIDTTSKNYDFVTDTVIKDQIVVLGINKTLATTQIVNSTSTNILPVTTATTATSYSINSPVLYVNSAWAKNNLAANQYYAVHPSISTGFSLITSISNGIINLSNPLSSNVTNNSYVTFIPTVVSVTNTSTFNPNQSNSVVSLSRDYQWQVDSAIVEPDGYIDPNKIIVSYFDVNDAGRIADPDAFKNIVLPDDISPQTGYLHNFIYFKYLSDGVSTALADPSLFSAYPDPSAVTSPSTSTIYYFYNSNLNVMQTWDEADQAFVLNTKYFAYPGRTGLKFQYIHNSGRERRIDPSKTNLMDIYLLTSTYDTAFRSWLVAGTGIEPLPPTSSNLSDLYSSVLDPIKSISDELVFHPAVYKVLFGNQAEPALQGTFKAVKNTSISNSTNNLKTRILAAIENFFALENWNFGDTFYFSELSTYVMNALTPDITNFVIVPTSVGTFGSLYEITSQSNEIFINGATVDNIEIIDAITASQLQASGSIVTNSTGA
jgi:hypothetical protein